jgi:hypothetical protein
MKNATVVPSTSRAFVIRLQGVPQHHGWALRYKSGSPELDAAKGPLWISSFRPQEGTLDFGDNPWLWESEADAQKVADHLRKNIEVEMEVEQH